MNSLHRARSSYLQLARPELSARAAKARELLHCCALCPRKCGVDRTVGELGACGIGADAVVSSFGPHFGEESVLVGRRGSGTIFFTGCNLGCVFCQNYDISQLRRGSVTSSQELAHMMVDLQSQGCHNINLVTPTHQVPAILDALNVALDEGLTIPLVYNCGGYESIDALKILDGIVDIYMPDFKYGDNESGSTYSGVPDYWDRCREALVEMHGQVGDLRVGTVSDSEGGGVKIAARGVLVRHLVLPNNVARTEQVMRFLAEKIGKDTFINIMDQYRPVHNAFEYARIDRPITPDEYQDALERARSAGLHRFAE